MKATIYMRDDSGALYQGATEWDRYIEKAILRAHKHTKNAWDLPTWAEVDGKSYNYQIYYNPDTGKDIVIAEEIDE